MSDAQKKALLELRDEFGPAFEAKHVRRYYKNRDARIAQKRAAVNRQRKIETISRREMMSIDLATEFYEVGHMI